MKNAPKIALAIALLISLFSTAQAQEVSFGLRGGVNFANVYTTEGLGNLTPDFKSYEAINLAAIAEIGITENFAFQPELAFINKGFVIAEDFDLELFNIPLPVGASAESRFRYVELPLLAKYKFGGESLNAYVMAGPTIGYAMSGRLVTRANALIDFKISDSNVDLDAIDYERFEVGGLVGAGVSINTTFGQLFADARYQRGFTQLYDIPVVDERIRNQGISLNVGFLVPIGGGNIRP